MNASQRGQALLVVVLVMIVALTVGLSLALRSVTELRNTTEEQNSQRAFSAAEAGIEQVLKTGTPIGSQQNLNNNASIQKVDINQVGGTSEFVLNAGAFVPKDEGVDIGLSTDYPTFNTPAGSIQFLTLYWGSSSDNCSSSLPAAIEVIIVTGTKVNPSTQRHTYDPCNTTRGNNFVSPDTTGSPYSMGGGTFQYRTPVTGPDNLGNVNNGLLVRVIPLYANAVIGVSTCNPGGGNSPCNTTLPIQAKKIDSTGIAGSTTRKVTFFQGYASLPSEFFQYGLISPK